MTSKFNIQAFTGRLMAMATEWRLDGVTHTHTHSNTHSRSVGIKDGSRSVFMSVFVCSPGSEAEEEGGRREPVRSLRFSSREKWNHFYKRKTSEVEKLNTETFTEKKISSRLDDIWRMKTGGDDRLDIYHTKQQTALLWNRFHCFHKLVQTCCVRVSLQGGLKCTRRRGRWEGGLVILQLTPPACTIQWTQTKLQLLSLFMMLGCSCLRYRLNQPIVKGKNEGTGEFLDALVQYQEVEGGKSSGGV